MLAVFKRELKAYLHTVIGFIFVAAMIFFIGLFFAIYNIYSQYPYFSYPISNCVFILTIAIPILTMRIISEERRNKTDQLILTAPVSVFKIVLGKYLAAVTVFLIPCAVSCVFPVIMSRFGTIAWGESYISILGFVLYGMACIAIGTFVSSLFENQIISAVVSFVLLFLGYMMSSLCNIISSTGNVLTRILGFYDLMTPLDNFVGGIIDFGSVFYYLSIAALFLFLTVQSIQKRRYSVSSKNFSFGAYNVLGIMIAIAIMVFANIGIKQIPSQYKTVDGTYNQMFTLSEDTKNYISNLDEDVNLYVICSEADYDGYVIKTLERYEALSDHVMVTYVDPNVSPRFYVNYTDVAPSTGSIIVSSAKNNKVIEYSSLYESTSTFNYSTYSYDTEYTGYDAEGKITSAIDYVLSDNIPVVYITEGHGENELDSTYEDAISKANVQYKTINLMNEGSVPEDASVLLINGPTSDFSEDDVKTVTDYLDRGGNVILTLYVTDKELNNVNTLMNYMELSLAQGLVVEENTSDYYSSPIYLLPEIGSSTYTSGLYAAGYNIFAPYSVGIIAAEEPDESISYIKFLNTSKSAYLMVNYMTATEYGKQEGDIDGPFPVGIAATKTLTDESGATTGTATMVVYSASTMFTSAADNMVSDANQKMFMNTINSFIDREINTSIPAKSFSLGYLTTSTGDFVRISVITVIIIPFGLLAAGIVIWARRRKY